MAWTAPLTWNVNDLVTAALMNQQLRDNMLFLKSQVDLNLNTAAVSGTPSGTFTSATHADLTGYTAASVTFISTKALVLVSFTWQHSLINGECRFDLYDTVASARVGGGTYGLLMAQEPVAGLVQTMTWAGVLTVAPGARTFKPQFATGSGTLTIGGTPQAFLSVIDLS